MSYPMVINQDHYEKARPFAHQIACAIDDVKKFFHSCPLSEDEGHCPILLSEGQQPAFNT